MINYDQSWLNLINLDQSGPGPGVFFFLLGDLNITIVDFTETLDHTPYQFWITMSEKMKQLDIDLSPPAFSWTAYTPPWHFSFSIGSFAKISEWVSMPYLGGSGHHRQTDTLLAPYVTVICLIKAHPLIKAPPMVLGPHYNVQWPELH